MTRAINPEQVTALLDALLCGSMAEAARRIGISERTPWRWLVQSKLGHPELQEISFCDVVAPFHIHHSQNLPALMAMQVQQTAFERARDGCLVDVFFKGQRMFEKRIKPEYADMPEDELWQVGPDWEKQCFETVPTKQWLKPSDALVVKMLEAWNRKRYGAHSTVDVNVGGVLRLSPEQSATKVIEATPAVFEDVDEDSAEQRGGHLALAAPAKSSDDFEARAAAGEFDQAEVTFKDADGNTAGLRPDIEALRMQAAELKRLGPTHPKPEGKVTVYKPDDEPKREPEKPEPIPQTLDQHPRAYQAPAPNPYRPPQVVHRGPASAIGTGREGIGAGPDPSKIGKHHGFSMTRGQ